MSEQSAGDGLKKDNLHTDPTTKNVALESNATVASAHSSPPVKKLTPEEQMALYEEDLKEHDWGHQPC